MKQRINWVDVAKGIGILLVVYGHIPWKVGSDENFPFIKIIYTFHMPLFIFLSGMFCKTRMNWKVFLGRKIETLLIPFLFYYLLLVCIAPYILTRYFNTDILGSYTSPISLLHNEYGAGPTWYLWALLLMSIVHYIISAQPWLCRTLLYLLAFIFAVLFIHLGGKLPFFIDSTIILYGYFLLGNMTKLYIDKIQIQKMKYLRICLTGGVILHFISYNQVYAHCDFPCNVFIVILGALLGTTTMIMLSKFINKCCYLEYMGKNSLVILCVHYPIICVYTRLINIVTDNIYIRFTSVFICTIATCHLFMVLIRKFIPFSIGEDRIITSSKLFKRILKE